MSGRSRYLIAALAALLALVGAVAVWLVLERRPPASTPFAWAAELTTVAGDGARAEPGVKSPVTRFSDPFAVAVDAKGAVYVADAGETNRIVRIGSDGKTSVLPGAFDTPSGLAVSRSGDVFVADTGANQIRKISAKGVVSILAGDGTAGFRDGPAGQAQFNGPIGVAVDGAGAVYVADTYNDRIRVISPQGQVKTLAGGEAPGFADGQGAAAAFDTPCGIALGKNGAILVADTGNDAIRRIDPSGQVVTLARQAPEDREGLMRAPVGLAVTPDGFVYISAFRRGRILQMAPSGEVRVLNGLHAFVPANAALRLATPAGLALDRHGALYVADPAQYVVRKLSPRRPGVGASPPEIVTAPPALVRAASVPWPLKPQTTWHEVVGDLGEVRGDYEGEGRDHIHAGLDIRAYVGQTIVAVADEKVESPLPAWSFEGLSEGLRIDEMTYIHMQVGRAPSGEPLDPARFQILRDAAGKLLTVRVKRGTRFHIGDPLGSVNRMAHVHLELGPPGGQVNPMALRFPGLTDHLPPHIDGVQIFDGSGLPLSNRGSGRLLVPRQGGAVSLVVDAWDQVDGDEARRRLGLYSLGFQVLRPDGTPVAGFEQPQINLLFDRTPLDPDAVKIVYAPDSGDTVHGAKATRFPYVVTNHVRGGQASVGGWNPAGLAPGDYIIRILAADFAGNQALAGRDLPISVR